MSGQTQAIAQAEAMGIDLARIRASLRRTPRERFERGLALSRALLLFRQAKPTRAKA
jgi:hypothetical protein